MKVLENLKNIMRLKTCNFDARNELHNRFGLNNDKIIVHVAEAA